MSSRRLAASLLALLVALTCVTVAAAKTPVLRTPAKRPAKNKPAVRLPAVSGVQSAQWKTWWGSASFNGGGVTIASQPPVTAAETHSALLTTKRTWQDTTFSFTTNTLQQLRRNDAPNIWEVGWVMFRFKDLENYYWFMLKTNGFELGKKQGSDTQIFLVSGDMSVKVGETRRIQIKHQGARIQVFVDGSKLVDYTDPHPLTGSGSIGLYEEDSQVRFDSLAIS